MSALNTQAPTTLDEQLWATQAEVKRLKKELEEIYDRAVLYGDWDLVEKVEKALASA